MGKRSDKRKRRKRELQKKSILPDTTVLESPKNEKANIKYKK